MFATVVLPPDLRLADEGVPDALTFDDTLHSYVPNPFPVRLTCVNNGHTPAYNVTGTIELPPNVVFDPQEQQRSAGAHALRFDAHGLRPGMYFIRLVAEKEVRQQKMVLLRY